MGCRGGMFKEEVVAGNEVDVKPDELALFGNKED